VYNIEAQAEVNCEMVFGVLVVVLMHRMHLIWLRYTSLL
jgi:hypothetical protein